MKENEKDKLTVLEACERLGICRNTLMKLLMTTKKAKGLWWRAGQTGKITITPACIEALKYKPETW